MGLNELVTKSVEKHEDFAVRLASDGNALGSVCVKLHENWLREPIFDTPRFVKNLERAYREMWKIFMEGAKPRHIEVVED
jgi:predicted O-linked N-acetylglucosamine transferase (SPINDLY family)